MQLHYWPVTREDYNVCNKSGSTITNSVPSTTVIGTVTITSPDVAFEIPALSAYDDCGIIGTVMTDVVLPLPASQVSSGYGLGNIAPYISFPFNYGDLYPNELPASAWFQQPHCGAESQSFWDQTNATDGGPAWTSSFEKYYPDCGTIWPEYYNPQLIIPSQISTLQSAWSGCSARYGLYDPPKAMQQVTVIASLTEPGIVTTQTASPGMATSVVARTSPSPADPTSSAAPTPGSSKSSAGADPISPQQTSQGNTGGDAAASPQQTSQGNTGGEDSASLGQTSQDNTVGGDPTSPQKTTVDPGAGAGAAGSILQSALSSSAASPGAAQSGSSDPAAVSAGGGDEDPGSGAKTSAAGGAAQSAGGQIASIVGGGTSPGAVAAQAVATGADGQAVTVVQQSGSVVLAAGGSGTTVPAGATATFAGDSIVAPASSGAFATVNGIGVPLTRIAATAEAQQRAVFTGADGQLVTMSQQGSSYIVLDGGSTTTIARGATAIIDGQLIVAPSSAGAPALFDGTPVQLSPAPTDDGLAEVYTEAVVSGADGSPVTIVQQGSSYVAIEGHSSITFAPGATAVIDGETIVAPTTPGGAAQIDRSAVSLVTSTLAAGRLFAAAQSEVIVTDAGGQLITILRDGSLVIVEDASHRVTVPLGRQITFDGETISVPMTAGGAAVLVDGSTLQLTATTTGMLTAATAGGSPGAVPPQSSTKNSALRPRIDATGSILAIATICLAVFVT
jgi:hypothetical protein